MRVKVTIYFEERELSPLQITMNGEPQSIQKLLEGLAKANFIFKGKVQDEV